MCLNCNCLEISRQQTVEREKKKIKERKLVLCFEERFYLVQVLSVSVGKKNLSEDLLRIPADYLTIFCELPASTCYFNFRFIGLLSKI